MLLDLVSQGVDLEAIEPGHELVGGPLGPVLGVHHEQHVREAGPEVGPVRVVVPGLTLLVFLQGRRTYYRQWGLRRDIG